MDLIFASSNLHKLIEIKSIINNHNIISLRDLRDYDEVEETGNTFKGNAFIKAKYFYEKYNKPVIADDSGLAVDALGGEPGVRSARYSGEGATYLSNNNKLLKALENQENRNASFITVICFIDESGVDHYFEGKINGIIIDEFRGDNGFGYDPIFYLPELDKTFAEMGSIKNTLSHRARALEGFKQFLNKEV